MSVKIINSAVFEARPAAILFDLDNTLYAYEPCNHAGLDAVRQKVEQMLSVSPEQFNIAFQEARSQIKARLGTTASSHSRLLYFQRTLELLGLNTQALLSLDLEQTFWRAYLQAAKLFEDAVDFLDDLRISGVPTGLVTDLTAQIQFRKIVYFGLEHAFDYVVTSEEAGTDKPDPSTYRLALHKLGVDRGAVWMIGDSLSNDIDGAKTAIGAVTLLKRHPGSRHGNGTADLTFHDFDELRDFVRPRLMNDADYTAPSSARA